MIDIILQSLLVAGAIFLFLVDSWFSYIAVMKLKEQRRQLGPIAKVFAYIGLGLALVKDAVLVLIFSVLLLTVPRELTLTAMLKRLQITYAEGGWRGVAAAWVCAKLLNQFDPSGKHC